MAARRLTNLIRFPLTVLVLLVMTSGCGSDTPTATSAPPSPTTSASDPPSTPTVTATSRPSPAPKRTLISWIKEFTPTGGGGSAAESAHFRFMKGDCATTLSLAQTNNSQDSDVMTEPYRGLYEGAAAACLAAFHGRTDLWPTAVARFTKISPSGLSCWDGEVYTIFKTLVQAYQVDPTGTFERKSGTPKSGCPELGALNPDHGPRSGGYSVEVTGRNLPSTLVLYWFDTQQEVVARVAANGKLTVVVPAAKTGHPAWITIKISGAYRTEQVYTSFHYDGCAQDMC